jgi:hypothetical protein
MRHRLRRSADHNSGSQGKTSVGLDSGSAAIHHRARCFEAGIECLIGNTEDLEVRACIAAAEGLGIDLEFD